MKYELLQLINIDTLYIFMDNLYRVTNIPLSIIGLDGNILLSNGEKEMPDNHIDLSRKLGCAFNKDSEYCIFQNERNEKYIAAPIIVQGYHLATLITGEFFLEQSDVRYYNEINKKCTLSGVGKINEITSNFGDKTKAIIKAILRFTKMISWTATRHAIQLETQEKLISSKKRLNLIIEGSNDVIWEWNMISGEFFVSEKWRTLTGCELSDNYNLFNELTKIIYTEDIEKINLALQKHIEGITEFFECEYRINTKSGASKWILQKGKILKSSEDEQVLMAGSITDITHKKIFEEEINYLAYYDLVTNLPNRIFFEKKLNEELNKLKPKDLKIAFFFIDIDDFKNINDIYGHEIGDKFLLSIANELKGNLERNEILCRFGGDEFLLAILGYESTKELTSKAEKLISISSKPLIIENKRFYTSMSVGISLYDEKCGSIEDMLKYSDIAMYGAKKSGKNNYAVFDKSLYEEFIRGKKLEQDLDKALENNEFILFYQPQIDVERGKVYGLEALLRWNHPEFGLLTPANFIDILEKSDKVKEVGKFVLYEACIASRNLETLGYDNLLISINICEKQLLHSSFVTYVQEIFEELDINPRNICFEITERMLLNKNGIILDTLDKLRSLGVEIFIDDFGTKYSSLNYLNSFNVSGIKIDKSFIDKIDCSKKNFVITKNIVKLTRDLDIHVIAEGVETKEQLNCLKDMNCSNIQGYLFSKPITYENLINYVASFSL